MVHVAEVERLLDISARQRRSSDAEVINRAFVVFLMAVWQTYVEAVANYAFTNMLDHARSPAVFPNRMLVLVSKVLRESKDERDVWKLAGPGWLSVLQTHRQRILDDLTGTFSTPSPANIDSLFEKLLGIKMVSQSWKWRGMTADRARHKLEEILDLRHQIGRTARSKTRTQRSTLIEYVHFVHRLAVCLHNTAAFYLAKQTGSTLWPRMKYRGKIGELS